MNRVGDFNPSKPPSPPGNYEEGEGDINPYILQRLRDDLFLEYDPAISLSELSMVPKHLQRRYVIAIRDTWHSESPRYSPRKFDDAEIALYSFLVKVIRSDEFSFSQEAKEEAFYFMDIELQSIREIFEPDLTVSTRKDSELAEKIIKRFFQSKYPIFNLESQIKNITMDKDLLNTLEQSLIKKDLSILISALIARGLNPRDYLTAFLIHLAEQNPTDDRARKLLERIIDYPQRDDKLEELSTGIWVRPSSYLSYEVLERIAYCVNNSSPTLVAFLSKNLNVSIGSKNTQASTKFYSREDSRRKAAMRKIFIEEEFAILDKDLSGYFSFPPNWIYSQRFNSRRYKNFQNQVEISINKRKPNMPNNYREKICSLLSRDLALETNPL